MVLEWIQRCFKHLASSTRGKKSKEPMKQCFILPITSWLVIIILGNSPEPHGYFNPAIRTVSPVSSMHFKTLLLLILFWRPRLGWFIDAASSPHNSWLYPTLSFIWCLEEKLHYVPISAISSFIQHMLNGSSQWCRNCIIGLKQAFFSGDSVWCVSWPVEHHRLFWWPWPVLWVQYSRIQVPTEALHLV